MAYMWQMGGMAGDCAAMLDNLPLISHLNEACADGALFKALAGSVVGMAGAAKDKMVGAKDRVMGAPDTIKQAFAPDKGQEIAAPEQTPKLGRSARFAEHAMGAGATGGSPLTNELDEPTQNTFQGLTAGLGLEHVNGVGVHGEEYSVADLGEMSAAQAVNAMSENKSHEVAMKNANQGVAV